MFDPEHVERLRHSVTEWNAWRMANESTVPKLAGADLAAADLTRADLRGARMHGVNLNRANLREANLELARLGEANLSSAKLDSTMLAGADLSGANLKKARLYHAWLSEANLSGANLSHTNLGGAHFRRANLEAVNLSDAMLVHLQDFGDGLYAGQTDFSEANLKGANLTRADLRAAVLNKADLRGANLSDAVLADASMQHTLLDRAIMINTDLRGADLTGASIYGISAWSLRTEGTKQHDLIIRRSEQDAPFTVDDIEVAQFIYMLLDNRRIRNVITTITSKVVLILGRFSTERKAVLDALREELRRRNYMPVIFDFEPSENRDLTETIGTLAHLARFVIADLTDAKSLPQELSTIIPALPSVPVQPILLDGSTEYAMFGHWMRFPWVLPVVKYPGIEVLLGMIEEKIIQPAEQQAAAQIASAAPPG